MTEAEVILLRHALHRHAEASGAETETARVLRRVLESLPPDRLLCDLGGHGIAAIFGAEAGAGTPTLLLRGDMDAVPVEETLDLDYASLNPGIAHKCGHDGHMAMLVGVGARLAADAPADRRVVLLFQPAEENGAGARRVLDDPRWPEIAPDLAVGLHNLPGFDTGEVVLRDGTFCCASKGMRLSLRGVAAHAAEPETGRSPGPALARLIHSFGELEGAPGDVRRVTVVGARLGDGAFGCAPGEATLAATLRATDETGMADVAAGCEALAREAATRDGLDAKIEWIDEFPATVNDTRATALVADAAATIGLPVNRPPRPFAWSEDFGRFTAAVPGALCGLGAGRDHPPLHHRRYDFPDDLLGAGIDLLEAIARAEGPLP